MTPAKFLSPVLVGRDGVAVALDVNRTRYCYDQRSMPEVLAASGQRPVGGVWPEGGGLVELEDIPDPVAEVAAVAAELRRLADRTGRVLPSDLPPWADRLDGAR